MWPAMDIGNRGVFMEVGDELKSHLFSVHFSN